MKKTDIALIVIIISISAGVAYWIASITIGQSNDAPIIVRKAEALNTDEVTVDKQVFSENGINPTVETTISGENLTSFIDEPTEGEDANLNEGETPTVESDPNAGITTPDVPLDNTTPVTE